MTLTMSVAIARVVCWKLHDQTYSTATCHFWLHQRHRSSLNESPLAKMTTSCLLGEFRLKSRPGGHSKTLTLARCQKTGTTAITLDFFTSNIAQPVRITRLTCPSRTTSHSNGLYSRNTVNACAPNETTHIRYRYS